MPAISTQRRCAATASCASALIGAIALISAASAAGYAKLTPLAEPIPPAIEARDLEGGALTVAADPQRVTLVHFFASWCEPCERELPGLTRFLNERPDDVRLVGVAVGEPASRAKKFVDRFSLPGPVASDPDKDIAKAFGVRGLPATVAIAPAGRAALSATGELEWGASPTRDAITGLKSEEH